MAVLTQELAQALVSEQGMDVVIPDIYTSIDDWAFYEPIEEWYFSGNKIELNSIEIPDSIIAIGDFAFYDTQLSNTKIPNSIDTIGSYAFSKNQLISVRIPGGIEKISTGAFRDNLLTSVHMPQGVTHIGGGTFANNLLESIELPSTLEVIGENAFEDNQLAEIFIPDTVTLIDENVFLDNPSLESISISEESTFDLSIFPDDVEVIRRSSNTLPTGLDISRASFNENIAGGSSVASLSSTDTDVGETFTYSLVSGDGDTDNSAFTIDGDQLKIVDSPDFETKSSYLIRLQTTDSGGLTFEKEFTLIVNDLEEGPFDTNNDGFVDEVTNYQMWTASGGVDLKNRRGKTYSEDTSRMWDAVKAVEINSGFSVLVEGQRKKDGKFKVVTANEEGVISGVTRWLNGNQMFTEGYEDLFAMDFNSNSEIGF